MKKSSAQQREPDQIDQAPALEDKSADVSGAVSNAESIDVAFSAPLKVSTFGLPNQVYADAARRAGRVNAAGVSEEEYQSLLRERQKLLDKKFEGTMTKPESNRLEYVRWSLDRIEDARHGASLDALGDSVGRFEHFLSELGDLKSQLSQRMKGSRK